MYTIGDFLIQVKNAYKAGKKQMVYPHSNVVESLGKILEKEGYIKQIKVVLPEKDARSTRKMLAIDLKYEGRVPSLSDVKLISKPSVHRYVGGTDLNRGLAHHGITILSTSSGIMTGKAARKLGVGGELICHIF